MNTDRLKTTLEDHAAWLLDGCPENDPRRANLTGANLTEAILTGAILTGANLRWANLTEANLTDVRGLK